MNELWIDAGDGFIYFATNEKTLMDALSEFEDRMWSIGCNVDNFGWYEIELRNENGDAIEHCGRSTLNKFV